MALRVEFPLYTETRIHSPYVTEARSAESCAHPALVLLNESKPVLGIIAEVQLSIEPRKRYAWPVYAMNLRAQLECPVHLLVVTVNDDVAKWAAQPIDLGGGNTFVPLVIGPSNVPEIVDDEQARAMPELAVLSAMAHGQDEDFTKAARIAAVAQRACSGLDTKRALFYFDLIELSLSEAARRALRHPQACEPRVPRNQGHGPCGAEDAPFNFRRSSTPAGG